MDSISWWGVLVGALTLFVIGAIWYTPLFGKAYYKAIHATEPDPSEANAAVMTRFFIGQFFSALVVAGALAWLTRDVDSVGRGALYGLVAGILAAALQCQLSLADTRAKSLLAINAGYFVVGLTAVGAVLGAFA